MTGLADTFFEIKVRLKSTIKAKSDIIFKFLAEDVLGAICERSLEAFTFFLTNSKGFVFHSCCLS